MFYLFIHLFLALQGLHCCASSFLVAGSGGYSLVAACGLLITVISLVAEQGLQGVQAQQLWLPDSRAQTQQLWCKGLAAPRHVGFSGSGIKPVSPALAGRFFTTELPGKPLVILLNSCFSYWYIHPKLFASPQRSLP